MLASTVQNIYIDDEWMAKEQLHKCKAQAQKKEDTEDAVKCFNLECIIDGKLYGRSEPEKLTSNELVNKDAQLNGVVQVDEVVDQVD